MKLAAHDLVVELEGAADWAGFRQACRVLLAERVDPDLVRWRWAGLGHDAMGGRDLFSAETTGSVTGKAVTPMDLERASRWGHQGASIRVSRAHLDILQHACLHADSSRFKLAYRWLYRLQAMPELRQDRLDRDWRALEARATAVRKEIHKMHAFVRFRRTERQAPPELPDLHIAWFEPRHHVVQAAAPFFVQRFANMHWAILTPEVSVHWDGVALRESRGAQKTDAPPPDAGEALWLTYYASTFNPARVKERAMKRQMPQYYWPDLPEARLISPLLDKATARTAQMLQRGTETPKIGSKIR